MAAVSAPKHRRCQNKGLWMSWPVLGSYPTLSYYISPRDSGTPEEHIFIFIMQGRGEKELGLRDSSGKTVNLPPV
jgi:hypothetical protein